MRFIFNVCKQKKTRFCQVGYKKANIILYVKRVERDFSVSLFEGTFYVLWYTKIRLTVQN